MPPPGRGGAVIVTGNITLRGLTFDSAAAAYTIGGASPNTGQIIHNTPALVTMTAATANSQLINATFQLGANGVASTHTFTNNHASNILTFAGNMPGGSGGTPSVKTVNVNGTGAVSINGAISNGGAAEISIKKTGVGSLSLGGSNTHSGTLEVTGGTVNLTGSILSGSTVGAVHVNPPAGTTSVLNVNGGSLLLGANLVGNSSIAVGTVIGGTGIFNMTSGSVVTGGAAADFREFHVGRAGFGVSNISGGSMIIGGFLSGGIATSGAAGIWNISGGSVSVATNGNFGATLGATAGTTGVMNITGTGSITAAATGAAGGIYVGENGTGILNVSGGGQATFGGAVGSANLTIGRANVATAVGIVNLGGFGSGGGTITTNRVQKPGGLATGLLNFHGGTLRAGATPNAAYMIGLTSAYVYAGGAKIDTNGVNITVGQDLLAPPGEGVSAISAAAAGLITTGYSTAPRVAITGPDGTGATAVATISPAGVLTGIIVTNPGSNYFSQPTVTLSGGGLSTVSSSETAAILSTNTSGGFTKLGLGTLTLTGFNDYTGPTTLAGGVLSVSSIGNGLEVGGIGTSSNAPGNLIFDGGTLGYTGFSSASDRGFTIVSEKTAGFSVTAADVDLAFSGSSGSSTGGLSKSGAGTLTLTGNHPYTGLTTVGAGTLSAGPGTVFGTSAVTIGTGGTLATGSGSTFATATTNVANGGVLAGLGTFSGTLTVNAGGRLVPGDPAIAGGILTTGSLVLGAGSLADIEVSGVSDRLAATTPGGLTLNGTSFNLYDPGTTSPVSANGVYPLIGYNTAWTGSLSNLTVNNPIPGKIYTFDDNTASDLIRVTLSNAPTGSWQLNGSGNWGIAGNWAGGVPNAVSALANLNQPPSAGNVTITLNLPVTLGSMSFNSSAPYTINASGGNFLTLNNGPIPSLIEVVSGSHNINPPLVLTGPLRVTAAESTALSFAGNISGNQALSTFGLGSVALGGTSTFSSVTPGPGTLVLGGNNTFPTLAFASGTVALTGTNNYTGTAVSGTGVLTIGNGGSFGAGVVGLSGASVLNFNRTGDYTIANDLTGTGAGVNKLGAGVLTISGTGHSYTGPVNVGEGTLDLTGTYNSGANTTSRFTVGSLASNAILTLPAGGSLTAGKTNVPSMVVGGVAGSAGSYRNSGGSLSTTSELWIGGSQAGSYGALTQNAGVTTSGAFLVVGNTGDQGVLNASGTAAIVVSTTSMTLAAGSNAAIGIANFSGNSSFTSTAANGSVFVGEFGAGTLNVSGGAALTTGTTGTGIEFGRVNTPSVGIVNLGGGTITTNRVAKTTAGGIGIFNFNGGTLRTNISNAAFMPAQSAFTAYVQPGGAVINTNGFNIGISTPLLAPLNNGVSAQGLTVSGGGFIDTPLVTISGDGTGATAIATINYATGALTGIVMTNPGSGYTIPPSFQLIGGGLGNDGAIGGESTLVPAAGGGLTKIGVGNLTLSGSNTYTGITTVGDGGSTDATRLIVAGPLALGSPAQGTVVNGQTVGTTGTILQINTGVTTDPGETLTLATGSAGQIASLYVGGPADVGVWGGNIILTGAGKAQLYSDGSSGASSLTVNGTISGSAGESLTLRTGVAAAIGRINGTIAIGSTTVNKTDMGTWTINSTGNTFGATNILQGTLRTGVNGALPATTAVSIGQAGTSAILDLNGTIQTVASIIDVASASAPVITSTTPATLAVNTSGTVNFGSNGGVLTGSTGVRKEGSGTLTLSGPNNYSGDTTVAGGTLVIPTPFLGNNSAVRLATGTMLNLGFSVGTPDTVNSLFIDGVQQAGGTWGSLASSAINRTALITGTGILQVTTSGDKYAAWTGTFPGLVTANDKLPATDFDKDGFVNLLEFIFGGDPTISGQSIKPVQTLNPANLVFTYKRNDDSESPVTTQTVEVGTDLGLWTAVMPPIVIGAASSNGTGYTVSITENGLAADDVVVSITRGTNTKLFARLKATIP